nr:hypothetical protein Iba_chr15fCG6010 [Ipomoea batatas]
MDEPAKVGGGGGVKLAVPDDHNGATCPQNQLPAQKEIRRVCISISGAREWSPTRTPAGGGIAAAKADAGDSVAVKEKAADNGGEGRETTSDGR